MKSTNLERKDAAPDPFLELESESFAVWMQKAQVKAQPHIRTVGVQRTEEG